MGQQTGARWRARLSLWPRGPEPFGPEDEGPSERMKAMPEPKQPVVKRDIAVSKQGRRCGLYGAFQLGALGQGTTKSARSTT